MTYFRMGMDPVGSPLLVDRDLVSEISTRRDTTVTEII